MAVKGFGVGDVLEYQTREHTTKPLAPGQFWTAYQFTKDGIILDEQLEIKVPSGRGVKFKSGPTQPAVSESGEYRVYTWHSSNLEPKMRAMTSGFKLNGFGSGRGRGAASQCPAQQLCQLGGSWTLVRRISG